MEKFLYFQTADNDAAMYPASRLQSIEHGGDTALTFVFAPGSLGEGQAASVDTVAVVITTQKEKEVMKAIADAIAAPGIVGNKAFIVIGDDINSEFIHPDLTSVGAITQDA